MPPYEQYLKETAEGTYKQAGELHVDEGVLGSFMPGRFLNQGNLPGFLPFMVPGLEGKPCTGVEGACATGSKAVAAAIKAVLSELADTVFVAGFEMQNTMKSVYGADVLAGAAYYCKERKNGYAHFFPGLFALRAAAYYDKNGYAVTRQGMAKWYEQAILNARSNPKAQEYHNAVKNLLEYAMEPPNPDKFIPHLNYADCSKISDGASSLLILSEEGLEKNKISKDKAIEIVAIGEAESDITQPPQDLMALTTTRSAVKKALEQARIDINQLGWLELHDCFSITALLGLEAVGFAEEGKGAEFILAGHTSKEGSIPTNLSGGLIGFGHPTGATGVRQLADLWQQLTGIAPNQAPRKKEFGMMVNMGGNDKTVSCLIVKAAG
jgi:acetyl-CoA C-acetyltransferase/acetyl-CoA acyltransferase